MHRYVCAVVNSEEGKYITFNFFCLYFKLYFIDMSREYMRYI